MKNKTTALIASTLLTALFASSSAIAGQATVTEVSVSAPISRALDAELFPTDHSDYIPGMSDDRVNYSIESAPISPELAAELFPDVNR